MRVITPVSLLALIIKERFSVNCRWLRVRKIIVLVVIIYLSWYGRQSIAADDILSIPEKNRAKFIEELAKKRVYLADPRAWEYINTTVPVVDYYERVLVEPPPKQLIDAALRVIANCESEQQKAVIAALLYRQEYMAGQSEFLRMVQARTSTARPAALSLALSQREAARHEVLKFFSDNDDDVELSDAIALWKHEECRTALKFALERSPTQLSLLIAASVAGISKEVELTSVFTKTKSLSEKISVASALACSNPKADAYVDFLLETLKADSLAASDRLMVIRGLAKANTPKSVETLLKLVDGRVQADRKVWNLDSISDDHEAIVILLSLNEAHDTERIKLGTILVDRLQKLQARPGLVLQAAYAAQIRNKNLVPGLGPKFAAWFDTINKAAPVAPSLLPLHSRIDNLHRIDFVDPALAPRAVGR